MRLAFQELYLQPAKNAEAFLRKWYWWATHSRLPPMIEAARMVKRHWNGILRLFQSKIANGIMEAINSLVQAAKAKARGYGSMAIIYLIAGKLELALPMKQRRASKKHMLNTMVSENQATVQRSAEAGTVTISARPRWTSEAAIDIALLVCALFLQRFSLAFGHTFLSLDIVPVVFILAHQFASGRLLIYYDRLLWFLALGFVVTCSLLLNYKNEMLSSYSLFIVMYFLFTLSRPATVERYKSTLQAFQFLVLVLACLAMTQFFAQFVVDGRQLVQFFGLIPDFLLGTYTTGGVNTIIPITGSLIKSNGIFLNEPSVLSQMTALAILIEVLGFRRLGYLFPLVFGYLVSYSGTGLMMLLFLLPLTVLADMRMILYGLLLAFFVFVLSVAGIVDLSVFVARAGEFHDTNASGFTRFVAPFWVAADYLELASARALLLGNGPGTTAGFLSGFWYGGMTGTPIKLVYEYGLIGSFVFILFIAQCCRGTLCPRLVVAAIFVTYVLGGSLLATPYLTISIVLLTLSRRERRRRYEKRAQPPNPWRQDDRHLLMAQQR